MTNQFSVTQVLMKSTYVLSLLFVGFLLCLTWYFAEGIVEWQSLATKFLIAGCLFYVLSRIVLKIPHGVVATSIHTTIILGLFAYLFEAVHGLQHIFVPHWFDDSLINIERNLIGTEATIFLQQFVNPYLTEGMMFAYVIYVPFLPLVAFFCYVNSGQTGAVEYLLNLSVANIICYVGFILIPVASPLYHQPELYTVPLEGGYFTWCGEWMRHNVHYAGGSLPSPHCAAATVMFMMLHRHQRKVFYIALPTILLLYISTVYGRYHYLSDAIAGIVTGVFAVKLSSLLITMFEWSQLRFSVFLNPKFTARCISERSKAS